MKKFTRIPFLVNDNFLPIVPGTILLRDNGNSLNYTVVGDIFTLTNTLPPAGVITVGQLHNRHYYTQNNIEFNFGIRVGNIIGNNMASLSFSSKNSGFIIYNSGITSVLNWGMILPTLTHWWFQNRYILNHRNYFLVSSVLSTANAISLYSVQNNTSIRLQSLNGMPLNNIGDLINIDTNLINAMQTVDLIKPIVYSPLLLETIRWDKRNDTFIPYI
jgi:hypothetical protein